MISFPFLAAVAPERVELLPGWLLPMDRSTISRGKSAVPLRHEPPAADVVDMLQAVETAYEARGLRAMFRLPDKPCFDGWRAHLSARAYRAGVPVLVQTAQVTDMRAVSAGLPADTDPSPDANWSALFFGPGFDAVDGASRSQALSRAPRSVFASVREGGRTVAVGAGAFSSGWASVHDMRTVQSSRGQGLAGRTLAGLADAANVRGLTRVFLQVEAGNDAALALYRRAGFCTAWSYRYWSMG